MDAKELRIGNWVIHNGIGYYNTTVKSVTNRLINQKLKHIYEPIQLTGAWLSKFGFNNSFENVYTLGRMQVEIYANATIIMINDEENDTVMDMEFENYHVHQLQNLYYALTGSELIII